jgi:hypothetical protein
LSFLQPSAMVSVTIPCTKSCGASWLMAYRLRGRLRRAVSRIGKSARRQLLLPAADSIVAAQKVPAATDGRRTGRRFSPPRLSPEGPPRLRTQTKTGWELCGSLIEVGLSAEAALVAVRSVTPDFDPEHVDD